MEHKEENKLWNSEIRKMEKEMRLDAIKDSEGNKRPLKVSNSKGKWIFSSLAIILALVFSVWGLVSLGVFQRILAYGYVNGEKISISEYNYTYNYAYSRLNQLVAQGIAPANSEGRIDLDAIAPNKIKNQDATWGEYLKHNTNQELIRVKEYVRLAKENNLSLSEDEEKAIDTQINQAIQQLGSELALENALVPIMGPSSRISTYREILKNNVLANKYIEKMLEGFVFEDELIEKTYIEKKDTIDTVTYREYILADKKDEGNSSNSEENKNKDFKKMNFSEYVDRFVSGITDENSFKQQVIDFSQPENKVSASKDETTLRKNLAKSSMPLELGEWLFSNERKLNDIKVFDLNETSKRVVLFVERKKPTEQLVNYGFILLNATDKEINDTNKEAVEKTLSAYEDRINKLSEIKTKEDFDKAVETLKEEGLQVVSNWSKEASEARLPQEFVHFIRKSPVEGQKLITKTDKNIIAYFFGGKSDKIAWKEQVLNILRNEKLEKAFEELEDETKYKIDVSFLGKHFINLIASSDKKASDVKVKENNQTEKTDTDVKEENKDTAK